MGISKRLLTLALALVMLVSTCVVVSAALPSAPTSTFNGVKHYRYWTSGPNSGIQTTYQVLKFNVNDGVIPLAYSGDVGKTASVVDHARAAQAEGYEVLGAINGSFFSLSSGDPCPALISGGRLMFATATREEVFTTFSLEGKPSLVQTTLLYDLTLDGRLISNGIGLVNKDYTAVNDVSATISTRFHYYDSVAGAIGNTAQTGYEILCEKINGTDIKVAKTLEGKVLSVTSGYYGKTIPTNKNQFVLFVKSSSSTYAGYAQALSAGDLVSLRIYSNNEWSNQILGNAYSAICDTYWLVNNGVNIAASQSEVGHSTTLSRPWTAFGWDDSGNIAYIITEGEKATLRDVAQEMINMGCRYVVRLDGGGSTAMVVNGTSTYTQGRLVTDALLIVKRPEDHRASLEATLKEAKDLYEGNYSAEANAYINQAYDSAFDVYKNSSATNDALKNANTNLKNAIAYIKNANNFAGKANLTKFLYVDEFDVAVPTGRCVIITPDFNGGNLTATNAGYGYSYGVLAEKLTNNTYKVVERYEKYKGNITLKSNQILIMTSYQKSKLESELNRDNMLKLAVGETLTFYGMDITYKYISAGAYIGANFSYVEPINPDPDPDPDPDPVDGIIGDVNLNGKIDARDYLLLKRAYFGTFTLDCSLEIADINGNGKIDARDYLLLKRAYFGTYTIE